LEVILDAYGKFESVAYDTQGILDDGSDLVLRLNFETEDNCDLIGFQVKSFGDLRDKNYMQVLKAQRDDSFRKVKGLRHYYMLICTDEAEHRDKVRNIEAEFRSADRTEIIEPGFALTFFLHPKTRIEALIKRTMEADDFVFREALNSIDLESPSARALAVFLSVHYVITGRSEITLSELYENKDLRSVYDELREKQAALIEASLDENGEGENDEEYDEDDDDADYDEDYEEEEELEPLDEFEPQLASDISLLEDDMIGTDAASEQYDIMPVQMRPLNAVVLDALVRYRYNEAQLRAYMFTVMGVRD
jgi:hypothetical protein